MLQIDIVKKTEPDDGYISKTGHLIVNSIEDKDSYYYEYKDGQNSATLYDEDAIEELLKHSIEDIGVFLYNFSYTIEIDNWDFWIDLKIICKKEYKDDFAPSIKAELGLESEQWNKPYSLVEFSKELAKTIATNNDPNYIYYQSDEEFVSNGFGILFSFGDTKTILSELEEKTIEKVEEILLNTKTSLIHNLDKEVITTFFTFPEHIKTPCKQYLIYFAQFLMDIGIEADTEIKEEAHRTLFKVIPKDNNDSLDKIKDALQVYLNAPSFDNLQTEMNNDVAVMQWQANVMHLKSQLTLANSVLQLKDATIQSLQLSNYQLQNILQDKKQPNETDKEEDIIKGVVSLKKYEGKGISINFAEILRRLKRGFQ